jgi:hypothetical protein
MRHNMQVKVKLFLCLTNQALRHEGVWGSGCIDPHFLDIGTTWRWVVSFTPRPLYPGERAPGTRYIRGWVDPRTGLDDVEKRKFLTLPRLELRPLGRRARSQSLYRLSYPGDGSVTVTTWKYSYIMSTGGCSPRERSGRGVPHTTQLRLVSRLRICVSSQFLIARWLLKHRDKSDSSAVTGCPLWPVPIQNKLLKL